VEIKMTSKKWIYKFKPSFQLHCVGFTLIEVMITMAILSVISVLVAQSIRQGVKNKVAIQTQVNSLSQLRDTIKVIEKDVQLAFHYRDIDQEIQDLIKKKNTAQQPNPNQGAPGSNIPQQPNQQIPDQPREVPRLNPVTHFDGEEAQMNFVTMNSGRLFASETVADFIEVGYSVKDCKSLDPKFKNSKCLWRRVSAFVDQDVTKGGKESVLVENVEEFKLRYFGKGKQEFNTQWRTGVNGDAATKGKFPELVEVSLTLLQPEGINENLSKRKKYSMQVVIPIHFPNNKE
jgi:prepilin-type N-terminal cleavage/methylation domain-containing protein